MGDMTAIKPITRKSAGVVFESDVLDYIDRLVVLQQRTRSFIINQIIRQHARKTQSGQNTAAIQPEPPLDAQSLIRF